MFFSLPNKAQTRLNDYNSTKRRKYPFFSTDGGRASENKKYRVFPLLAPTCHKDRTTVLRTEKGKQEHAEHKTLFGMPGMRLQKSLLTWGNAGDCFRDSNKEEVGVSQLAARMILWRRDCFSGLAAIGQFVFYQEGDRGTVWGYNHVQTWMWRNSWGRGQVAATVDDA